MILTADLEGHGLIPMVDYVGGGGTCHNQIPMINSLLLHFDLHISP